MKKKLSFVFALILFVGCLGFNVSAKPSITVNGATDGAVLQNGKVVDGSYATFSFEWGSLPADVQDMIAKLNNGTAIADVLDLSKVDTDLDLSNYALLTQLQDLKAYDAQGNEINEDVTVSWEVPNLTKDNYCKLAVLHYSEKRNQWETIKPDKIDLDNNKITVTFKDLSPVAVIYDPTCGCEAVVGGNDSTNGSTSGSQTGSTSQNGAESTNTGAQTNTALYAGIGVVAVLAGAFFVVKSKKSSN